MIGEHCTGRPIARSWRKTAIAIRPWHIERRGSRAALAHLSALFVALLLVATGCTGGGPADSSHPADRRQLFGVFVGSDADGVRRIPEFEQFLGGVHTEVGHTYLPGETWSEIEGPAFVLDPWSAWQAQNPDDLFVLNIPMAAPNEAGLSDGEVAEILRRGAEGEYDEHFVILARRLVEAGLQNSVLVPGWEMNGITYSHRCGPDPEAWKTYFRRIVATLRAQPGQNFRFDFNPSRGTDAIAWPECYPGDDVVDIIGMDSYDQAPGTGFADYIEQPNGLQDQVDFAAERGKPVSYPEWGLFRYGDNPEYVREMHRWMAAHDTVYSTLTDYCPHGVLFCQENPRSAEVVQDLFGR